MSDRSIGMENIADNRVGLLAHELRNMRDEIFHLTESDKQTNMAAWIMDSQLLRELELTTDFVRSLSLQCSIMQRSKPASTIRDVVESFKLRRVVEELQIKRAVQRERNDQKTILDNNRGSFQEIRQVANRVWGGIVGLCVRINWGSGKQKR